MTLIDLPPIQNNSLADQGSNSERLSKNNILELPASPAQGAAGGKSVEQYVQQVLDWYGGIRPLRKTEKH